MVQCVHPAAVSLNDQLDKLAQFKTEVQIPPIPHTNITNHCIHVVAAQCRSVTGRNERECCMGGVPRAF